MLPAPSAPQMLPASWAEPDDLGKPLGELTRACDPEEASAAITAAYAPHRLRVIGRRTRFDVRLWGSNVPGLRLGYMTTGSDLQLAAPPPADCYVVCFTARGRVEIGSSRESQVAVGSAGAVVRPGEPVYFEDWSPDCLLVTARFDKAALEDTLAAMLGHPLHGPIRFRLAVDLAAPQAGPFLRALQLLHSELTRPDSMTASPAMAASLSQLAMTALLTAQPHDCTAELQAPARPSGPGPVRAAIELIESRPAEVVSVADLAKAANLSVRALEEGFRRHVGMPPMTYLREIRLARVHDELRACDPDATTAAAVAQRWGFSHYGRFAAAYRAKYGVAPSQALQARPGA